MNKWNVNTFYAYMNDMVRMSNCEVCVGLIRSECVRTHWVESSLITL